MLNKNKIDKVVTGILQNKDKSLYITIGVLSKAPDEAYTYDMTFLELKIKNETRCAVMTPVEAVIVGASLIRASALADVLINAKKELGSDWATNWEQRLRELRDKT